MAPTGSWSDDEGQGRNRNGMVRKMTFLWVCVGLLDQEGTITLELPLFNTRHLKSGV